MDQPEPHDDRSRWREQLLLNANAWVLNDRALLNGAFVSASELDWSNGLRVMNAEERRRCTPPRTSIACENLPKRSETEGERNRWFSFF